MKRLLLGMLLVCGSAKADLVVTPWELDFQIQAIQLPSEPRAATFTNTGNEAVTVVAIATVLPPLNVFRRAGGSCGEVPFTLAPQATCTISYTFAPLGTHTYSERFRVTLAGGSSVEFVLRGVGDVGFLQMSPSTLEFPPTPIGTASPEMSVLIENPRPVAVSVRSFMPTNSVPAASAFVLTGGTCPTPPFLFPAQWSCMLFYTFLPAQQGDSTTDIAIRTGWGSGFFVFTLTGTGLPELPLFGDGFEQPPPAAFE